MPDPYLPALNTFALTDDEQTVVTAALSTEKPWDWQPGGHDDTVLIEVKKKIRDLHLERHGNRCCYCRFPMHGGGYFVIDPEHILPKSTASYRCLAYTIWNLGMSCKRCNMQYKRRRIDFVIDANDILALQKSTNYRLIHPNFDLYKDHISIRMEMNDDITIIKYIKKPGSNKGEYTYEYFNLEERETDLFDQAQGIDVNDDLGDGALAALDLAREYDQ